jgi:shikimate kinase
VRVIIPSDPLPFSTKQRGPLNAVFLVGFMGAGKTSVGRVLAASLGWRFVDLDARIVAKSGRSVPEIFEAEGEVGFRRSETAELAELFAEFENTKTVVSLGGGAWIQPATLELTSSAAVPVFFLDAPVAELWRRCLPEQGNRPLLSSELTFRELYSARREAYATGTTLIATGGLSIEEVAAQIQILLGITATNV